MARELTDGQRAAARAAIARRGELDLTQKQLAKKAAVSLRAIQNFETFRTWPQADTLARMERMGLDWYVGYLNEYAARYDNGSGRQEADVDRDITDIMESNLHPDLKLRLIDQLREIRGQSEHERSMSPERDVG